MGEVVIPEEARRAAAEAFHPSRFRTGPKMVALLGGVAGEDWTSPRLVGFCTTSDGHVLARPEGHAGYDAYFADLGNVLRNLRGACKAAGLDDDHATAILAAFQGVEVFYRRPDADDHGGGYYWQATPPNPREGYAGPYPTAGAALEAASGGGGSRRCRCGDGPDLGPGPLDPAFDGRCRRCGEEVDLS